MRNTWRVVASSCVEGQEAVKRLTSADDEAGRTLVAVSSVDATMRGLWIVLYGRRSQAYKGVGSGNFVSS